MISQSNPEKVYTTAELADPNIHVIDSLYRDITMLPETVIDKSWQIGSQPEKLTALLMAAGGSIALRESGMDEKIADHRREHMIFDDKWADETLNIAGGPGAHFAVAGIWYALAHNSGDQFNKDRAWKLIEALSISGATTVGLKVAVWDRTPNGKLFGWPSGHTASSFALASVLDEYYGPNIGIPAYGFASLVAFRMIDTGDHWASDILFGATLGWITGHQVAGEHKKFELAGFKILPYYAGNNADFGISLVKRF